MGCFPVSATSLRSFAGLETSSGFSGRCDVGGGACSAESEVVTVSRRAEGVVLKERRTLSCREHCIDRASGRDALSNAIAADVPGLDGMICRVPEGDLDFLIGNLAELLRATPPNEAD